jgi:NAD(P)-dependent dehydrogenase (short-subunit alcohol dehydrogenase family)
MSINFKARHEKLRNLIEREYECRKKVKAMDKAEGLVVIITGANNGIGLNMAKTLLQQNYFVAAFDLEGDNLTGIRQIFPDKLMFCRTDVTNDLEVTESVQTVVNKWGKVDILVNNACLAIFTSFEQKDIDDTKREFDVNYFGYVRMIKAVLPYMKSQERGIIHNVSSGVGITGFPGIYGYASTKGAIEALTLTLAFEFEKYGISVNTIHPPLTNTKSASQLGIPTQVMADAAKVGQQLAGKILSTTPVVTPNLQTRLYLYLSRRFPGFIGRFMGKMTEKEREKISHN